jgi:hypothetical protein
MSAADYNRAVSDCAYTIARIAERAAALPAESPAQRRRVAEMLLLIAAELRALEIVEGVKR